MESRTMLITPQMAEQWLNTVNKSNRKIRKYWVDHLAQEIRSGNFLKTHQGIGFSKSGRLLDGQHRLAAIIKADTPVEILVTTDLDDEAFKAMDNGVKRTMSDLTNLSVRTAEVCKFIARHAIVSGQENSPQLILDIADTVIGKLCGELERHCPSSRKTFSSVAVRAVAVLMVAAGHDKKYIFETYTNMVLFHLDELPPVARAFVKQVIDKHIDINSGLAVFLAKLMKVFDKNSAYTSRLSASSADCDMAIAFIKDVASKIMNK